MHAPSRRLLTLATSEKVLSFYYRCVQFSPHPAKAVTGGEDAFLSLVGVQAVLDGVSWWREHAGVDAGLYSAALARAMHAHVEEELMGDCPPSSRALLQSAYESCRGEEMEGTATALVATLQPPLPEELREMEKMQQNNNSSEVKRNSSVYSNGVLDICSLGDCTALLVRRGRIIFESEEQTHDLDFPYQLGRGSSDTPARALNYRVPVEPGDMLLLGTDGIFDNIYPNRAAELMWSLVHKVRMHHIQDNESSSASSSSTSLAPQRHSRMELFENMMHALSKGSEDLLREARSAARDRHADTPYAHKAIAGGAYYEGGKEDDMTLLVSVIDEEIDADSGERFIRSAVMNPYPYRDWP